MNQVLLQKTTLKKGVADMSGMSATVMIARLSRLVLPLLPAFSSAREMAFATA